MKIKTEKLVKHLKKIKALEKQKQEEEQAIKPAVRIQELKNKLIILAHELKVDKKINDTLYRKLQLLTYSRTTEQKLKDSYKTLKDIENKINTKTDTPEKTKKITIKDFKENKKTVDDDRNVLYNIYIKLKITLYKHMGKTILLIKLKILLKLHLVIHIHTKLKY